MQSAPSTLNDEQMLLWESLWKRLITLDERVWNGNVNGVSISNWLRNFDGKTGATPEIEQLHALYILSNFTYFGYKEIRVLLKALYRELFLFPLSRKIRSTATSLGEFSTLLTSEINATKFLGVGNPSESGTHLLYYFRQENLLSKNHFLDSAQIFKTSTATGSRSRVLRHASVNRYIFLDDMCGSGETAVRYSNDFLPDIVAARHDIELWYLSLFATRAGIERVRDEAIFHNCAAVYELDSSYKCSEVESRYLTSLPKGISKSLLVALPYTYGSFILPNHPLGYLDSQLLLGFFHNTPDNTLPIIWCDQQNDGMIPWYPIFRRFPKV